MTLTIDVREPDEFSYEHIPGSINIPLSRLPDSFAKIPKDKPIALVCQSGVRSKQALELLRSAGYSQLKHVEGGLNAWKSQGLAVERRKGAIPIMRQVQIVAGSLALIGGVVPGARWVAAFVGVGLIFAGASGICTMANILAHMPWNKTPAGKGGPSCGTDSGMCR